VNIINQKIGSCISLMTKSARNHFHPGDTPSNLSSFSKIQNEMEHHQARFVENEVYNSIPVKIQIANSHEFFFHGRV